tara:strand:- start:5139 stop:6902 length:1764 start_codon:yes stop_codon:yes gene_type:complete
MKLWWMLALSAVVALVSGTMFLSAPANLGQPANPMDWASDDWVQWTQMTPGAFASLLGTQEVLGGEWVRVFRHAEGWVLQHHDLPWERAPQGSLQKPWRGGWISGPQEALDAWDEDPATMSAHWRNARTSAELKRLELAWAWQGEGWVIWPDTNVLPPAAVDPSPLSWQVEGTNTPSEWWSSRLGESPMEWPLGHPEGVLLDAGIPLHSHATRWRDGGRFRLLDPGAWKEEVEGLALQNGWRLAWMNEEAVIEGDARWEWSTTGRQCLVGKQQNTSWTGTSTAQGAVVWASLEEDDLEDGPLTLTSSETMDGKEEGLLGEVRNHRSGARMGLFLEEDHVVAKEAGADVFIWSFPVDGLLPGGACEVDVYANGKFQAMFGEADGLHLVDVKGREVVGFPLRPNEGEWTAWALVDYDRNRSYRYLVADDASGLVRNFRKEGQATPGWSHRPAEGVDTGSPVRHLVHLRLGSRDYVYVGRENGQVELLKRNGATRAQTQVQVDPTHAPLFRTGADLNRTSVLFLDGTGFVREFVLGTGEAAGISGQVQADRMSQEDVDGDGILELVTWWRGESTAWDARNEPINRPEPSD